MEAEVNTPYSGAFVAKEDDLKKLHKLFADRIGPVSISAECADQITRRFALAELLAYPNTKIKRIISLYISARSDDHSKEASLSLPTKAWSSVTLKLRGREDVVASAQEKAADIIAGMIPWYSRIQRLDFTQIAFAIFVLFWLTALVVVALELVPNRGTLERTNVDEARGSLLLLSIVVGLIVVTTGLNHLRDYLFPKGAFLIGQGKTRYELLEKIQWGVIIAFVVSLVAGLPLLLF